MHNKLFVLALTLFAAPMAASPPAAIACFMETSSGQTVDLGSLCQDGGGEYSAPVVQSQPTQNSSVTICNERNHYIEVAISSGDDSNRLTEGTFLLTDHEGDGDCVTRTVLGEPGDAIYVRAWRMSEYGRPQMVHTNSERSFCYSAGRGRNSVTTEDECDRLAGSNNWAPFEFYRIARDGTKDIAID